MNNKRASIEYGFELSCYVCYVIGTAQNYAVRSQQFFQYNIIIVFYYAYPCLMTGIACSAVFDFHLRNIYGFDLSSCFYGLSRAASSSFKVLLFWPLGLDDIPTIFMVSLYEFLQNNTTVFN